MSGTGVRHIRAAPKELIMEDKAPQLRKRKKRGWAHVGAGADKAFDVGYDAGLDDVGLGWEWSSNSYSFPFFASSACETAIAFERVS